MNPRINIRTYIRERPLLYFTLGLFTKKIRTNRVRRNTDLVLEGFPRSANSFSLNFLRNCQSREYRIAHHLHAPAQFIYGCKHKVPCMILIRNPFDSICSLKIMRPDTEFEEMIADYRSFYSKAWTYREQLYFARFEEVIENFNPIIAEFNARYGADFSATDELESKVNEAFESMKEYNVTEKDGNPWELPIPTSMKDERKQEIRGELVKYEGSLVVCNRLYEKIIAYAGYRNP